MKSKEEIQRDCAGYESRMYLKALRMGKPQEEARVWAREQVNMQVRLREKELEELKEKREQEREELKKHLEGRK